jgi:hypothetical protein
MYYFEYNLFLITFKIMYEILMKEQRYFSRAKLCD